MSYLPTIPAAGDVPSKSQGQIQTNFNQLNSQIGTEHTALNAASGNGLHKYVTLQQAPGAPAPTGTNVYLSQELSGGTAYMRFLNASAQNLFIPVRHNVYGIAIPAGTNTVNLVDMATILSGSHSAGTLMLFDNTSATRNIFTLYSYRGGTLGVSLSASGMLTGSPSWPKFVVSGTVIQLQTNATAAPSTATLIVTESFA